MFSYGSITIIDTMFPVMQRALQILQGQSSVLNRHELAPRFPVSRGAYKVRSKKADFFVSSSEFLQFPLIWQPEEFRGYPQRIWAATAGEYPQSAWRVPAACFQRSPHRNVFPSYPQKSCGAGLQERTHQISGVPATGFQCSLLSSIGRLGSLGGG